MNTNTYYSIYRFSLLYCSILFLGLNRAFAQLESFQTLYQTDFFTHCYDVAPTLDNGYIITGFEDKPAPFNVPLVPYLCKINCQGKVDWVKKFGQTTGIDNTDPRVSTLNSGDYMMMSTVLAPSYDILLVRTTPEGETVWKKTYGGTDKDVGRGMLKLKDDNVIVVGSTRSYGTDIGSFYSDMYALKINTQTGDTLWTKTYGNPGGIDDLWGLTEAENGELTFIGRSFYDNGIWLSLIHTDKIGNILWTKYYGKTNHHAQGFDIITLADGGFAFTGFTTLAKQDFNSFSDIQVIRTNPTGDLAWAKVFHGSSPDLSELGSTILAKGDTLVVALESSSYPTIEPDITKQLLYLIDASSGNLLEAKSFNGSGGQFPMIRKDWSGYIMSGMTDEFPGSWNDPILRKLDDNFNSGCQETDWTSMTQIEEPSWDVAEGSYSSGTGSFAIDYSPDSLASIYVDSTFCFTGEIPGLCEVISSTEFEVLPSFKVYPNPASNLLNIQCTEPTTAIVQLFNINGHKLISKGIQNSQECSLNLSPFPSGVYILQIQDGTNLMVQKVNKL